jgi:hypothetical protein
MGSSDNQETPDEGFNNTFHHHSSPSSSSRDGWKNRIFFPTLLAGISISSKSLSLVAVLECDLINIFLNFLNFLD